MKLRLKVIEARASSNIYISIFCSSSGLLLSFGVKLSSFHMQRVILFIILPVLLESFQFSSRLNARTTSVTQSRHMRMLLSPHDIIDSFSSLGHFDPQTIGDHLPSFLLSADDASTSGTAASAVVEAASPYSKVDKTGVIGFIATYVEAAIDAGHVLMQKVGIQYSYGFSIMLFTLFGMSFSPFYLIYLLLFDFVNTSDFFSNLRS